MKTIRQIVTKVAPEKTTAKKVTPKAVVKKAVKPVAKTVTKKAAKKDLVHADNHSSFWLSDGQILNSLLALRDAFATMEKEVYTHHVSVGKNDFAQWVEIVLDDAPCAKSLKTAKTPAAAHTVVVKYLKLYNL
jgi:hypothetical protein